MIIKSLKQIKRIIIGIIGIIGFTVLLIGIAMILVPGPEFIVIPVGLAILATEFVWA
jgi:tellurite resistance protein TerC